MYIYVFLLFYLFWVYLYQHVFDFQDVFFYDHLWFAVTLLQQAASKGAAPKAKAKAKAVAQSPKKEEGGLPFRHSETRCLLVVFGCVCCLDFLCIFCVVKLFDLEFLNDTTGWKQLLGGLFLVHLGWIRDSMLVERFCGYFHETTSPKFFIGIFTSKQ